MSSNQWDDAVTVRRKASFGRTYNDSQMEYPETEISTELSPLIELHRNVQFNNCLLNCYGSGDNTMGFHPDDTMELVNEA